MDLDCVVVGAGVVGLAIARELSLAGREVVVLEAAAAIGTHASSRNSEVIHAGIYYPEGSRKARHCVRGRHLLYEYCAKRDIAHRRVGKIIVATSAAGAADVASTVGAAGAAGTAGAVADDDQTAALEKYAALARSNGVDDLEWLDARDVAAREPAVRCVRGLWSPSTGIVDSDGLMRALKADAQDHGARVVLSTPLVRASVAHGGGGNGIEIDVGGAEPTRTRCRTLVNAAGLFAPRVARSIEGLAVDCVPRGHLARGHYFTLAGSSPFSHLVYPVPAPGGLGIHVTLDLAGRARFGPDVQWIDDENDARRGPTGENALTNRFASDSEIARGDAQLYAFDEARAPSFYRAIRTYYPALADGALEPGYVGVRAKLTPAGAAAADFVVQGPSDHRIPGLVNLYGIESPGLTASLAIAEEVVAMLVEQ